MPRTISVHVFSKLIIANRRGEILMLKRAPGAPGRPQAWDLPGGTLEQGEQLADSLPREVREETGLALAGRTSSGLKVSTLTARKNWRWSIRLRRTAPTSSFPNEHTEYRWLPPTEALALDFGPQGEYLRRGIAAYASNAKKRR